jgi:hypothetical protein
MGANRFGARTESLEGPLPHLEYRWDAETEILSGMANAVVGPRGLTGSVELEDAKGAVVTLDFAGGVLRGLEVVVWPTVESVVGLAPPAADEQCRFVVPARPSQPGIAVLEVDVLLSVAASEDESVIHLKVGPRRGRRAVAVADNLLIELDAESEIAGFWLLNVPPFPTTREAQ